MKKFYVEESGYYKISTEVIAENDEDAIDVVYSYLPSFIDVESNDTAVQEMEQVKMKFEKQTRQAMVEVIKILDWECDNYEWGTDEYETLQEIMATIQDILRG